MGAGPATMAKLACLPEPMLPVDKLSQRFSLTPVSAQDHCDGSLGMVLPVLGSWCNPRAYLLTGRCSSQTCTLSCLLALSCFCSPMPFVDSMIADADLACDALLYYHILM